MKVRSHSGISATRKRSTYMIVNRVSRLMKILPVIKNTTMVTAIMELTLEITVSWTRVTNISSVSIWVEYE